jgi:hypothetical protein
MTRLLPFGLPVAWRGLLRPVRSGRLRPADSQTTPYLLPEVKS